MRKELTLKLDESAIKRAKGYADERGLSVSELVENQLLALPMPRSGPREKEDRDLPPITRSLVGCFKGEETDAYAGHPDEEGRVDVDVSAQ